MAYQKHRIFQPELFYSALDNTRLEADYTSHLDSTAERDLAITLREVEIAY